MNEATVSVNIENDKSADLQVAAGLDFILAHLSPDRLWPRTISTHKTAGRQIMARNKSECLAHFRESNFVDCRLNAYQNDNSTPNLIFIDIDKSDFKTKAGLEY